MLEYVEIVDELPNCKGVIQTAEIAHKTAKNQLLASIDNRRIVQGVITGFRHTAKVKITKLSGKLNGKIECRAIYLKSDIRQPELDGTITDGNVNINLNDRCSVASFIERYDRAS